MPQARLGANVPAGRRRRGWSRRQGVPAGVDGRDQPAWRVPKLSTLYQAHVEVAAADQRIARAPSPRRGPRAAATIMHGMSLDAAMARSVDARVARSRPSAWWITRPHRRWRAAHPPSVARSPRQPNHQQARSRRHPGAAVQPAGGAGLPPRRRATIAPGLAGHGVEEQREERRMDASSNSGATVRPWIGSPIEAAAMRAARRCCSRDTRGGERTGGRAHDRVQGIVAPGRPLDVVE